MTNPESSSAAAAELFYVVAEFDMGPYRWAMTFAFFADHERHAAEQAAGIQIAGDARPARISVYRGKPVVFEWRRTENYLMDVGQVVSS